MIREQLSGYIATEILKDPQRAILEDEPLISSGLIDSFHLVDLALYIEETFHVKIEDFELSVSVFDTIAQLEDLVSLRIADRSV